jgi:hypothetical protein
LLGLELTPLGVSDIAEIERAFDALTGSSISGLVVMPDPLTLVHRERIVALAADRRMTAVYPYRYFAEVGGLVSYGPILLQKSKVGGLRISCESMNRKTIADSCNFNRVTEVACEFNVRRRGPSHLYTKSAPAAVAVGVKCGKSR